MRRHETLLAALVVVIGLSGCRPTLAATVASNTIPTNVAPYTGTFTPNLSFNWTLDARAAWHGGIPNRSYKSGLGPVWHYNFTHENSSDPGYLWGSGTANLTVEAGGLTTFWTIFEGTTIYAAGTSPVVNDKTSPIKIGALTNLKTGDQVKTVSVIRASEGDWTIVGQTGLWQAYILSMGSASQDAPIVFRGFTVTMGIAADAATMDLVPKHTVYTVAEDASTDTTFKFAGSWAVENRLPDYAYMSGTDWGDTCAIDIPANTSLVMLNGTVAPEYGTFRVVFDPEPPGYMSERLSQIALNAYNNYHAPAPLVVRTLDPRDKYTMTVVARYDDGAAMADPPGGLGVHSVTFYSASCANGSCTTVDDNGHVDDDVDDGVSHDSTRPNTAAIAGGVAGGVVGVAFVAFAVWYGIRNCRRRRTGHDMPPLIDIDDDPNVTQYPAPTPYPISTNSPSPPATSATSAPRDGYFLPWDTAPGPSTSTTTTTPAAKPHLVPTTPPAKPPVVGGDTDSLPVMAERPRPRPRRIQQEQDGGGLPVDDDVELVPPTYDPAWLNNAEAGPST